MLLLKIKAFVKEHREVSLTKLAQTFDLPESVMEDMLKRWVDKGIIARYDAEADCAAATGCSSGCSGCALASMSRPRVLYRWQG